MAIALITNPVGTAASKIFAGFRPVEFQFKREDLAITGVTSGTGGITVTVATNLTSVLAEGDAIYVYSEGTNYTYDAVGTILSISATQIVVDITFVEAGTGGYINYLKNYYVEMMLVDKTLSTANILPFTLRADGSPSGVVDIDVSIAGDKLLQRGAIDTAMLTSSRVEFEVKYKQVYSGSSETYTLIDNKLVILLYATETPETETILNSFDLPKIILGYPAAIVVAYNGAGGDNLEVRYEEKDINGVTITTGTLGTIGAGVNGFAQWEWESSDTVTTGCKYVDFEFTIEGGVDFRSPDFEDIDFLTGA